VVVFDGRLGLGTKVVDADPVGVDAIGVDAVVAEDGGEPGSGVSRARSALAADGAVCAAVVCEPTAEDGAAVNRAAVETATTACINFIGDPPVVSGTPTGPSSTQTHATAVWLCPVQPRRRHS
jgi:hypothetical protein